MSINKNQINKIKMFMNKTKNYKNLTIYNKNKICSNLKW